MKKQFFTLTHTTIIGVFCLSNTVLAQNLVDPIQQIIDLGLGNNCQNTIELNYRSSKLTAPNGKTSAYFEGVLRTDKNRLHCHLGETPITTMIVEEKKQKFNLKPSNDCYETYTPISFSPNSRYLVVQNDTACLEGSKQFQFLDTQKNYKELPVKVCYDDNFGGNYIGFISSSEILFKCVNLGYELVNLSNQSLRKVSESFAKSAKTTKLYGTISGKMTITKKQVFPRR